jgi:hypothetical protein
MAQARRGSGKITVIFVNCGLPEQRMRRPLCAVCTDRASMQSPRDGSRAGGRGAKKRSALKTGRFNLCEGFFRAIPELPDQCDISTGTVID